MSSTPSPKPFSWEYRPTALAKEAFHITGGRPLSGSVRVSGAKNAALKMMAASVLTGERLHLENVPEILDIEVLRDTLRDLGVTVVGYPEAEHAFAHDPSRPVHRADDAKDAFARARAWLEGA